MLHLQATMAPMASHAAMLATAYANAKAELVETQQQLLEAQEKNQNIREEWGADLDYATTVSS